MYLTENFGWVFIYIFAFGISDLFVKHVIKSDLMILCYYFVLGILGITMIYGNLKYSKYSYEKKM